MHQPSIRNKGAKWKEIKQGNLLELLVLDDIGKGVRELSWPQGSADLSAVSAFALIADLNGAGKET